MRSSAMAQRMPAAQRNKAAWVGQRHRATQGPVALEPVLDCHHRALQRRARQHIERSERQISIACLSVAWVHLHTITSVEAGTNARWPRVALVT